MRNLLLTLLVAGAILGFTTRTRASVPSAWEGVIQPAICEKTAFAESAHFMSLAGYLRWQHFQQTGTWMTSRQAMRMTRSQLTYCAVPRTINR